MASAARRRRPTTTAGKGFLPNQPPRLAHGEAVSAARTVGQNPPPLTVAPRQDNPRGHNKYVFVSGARSQRHLYFTRFLQDSISTGTAYLEQILPPL